MKTAFWAALALSSAAFAASADSAREARALEARLNAMSDQVVAERENFAREVTAEAALAAELDHYAPEDPATVSLKAALRRKVKERQEKSISVVVQSTLMARRLQAYKTTGVLPPEAKDDGSIERSLRADRPAAPEPRRLPLDLVALAKELGLPAPASVREKLPARAPAVARAAAPERAKPLFQRITAAGRTTIDPVPALIAQLSAGEAKARALAADELAGRGAEAAAAIPALRKALADADARVRSSSATALGEIAAPGSEAAQDLRRALQDRNEEVRLNARAALARLDRRRRAP